MQEPPISSQAAKGESASAASDNAESASAAPGSAARVDNEPILFPVSPAKWLLMNLGTFNIYAFFWFWKNWTYLKYARGAKVSPMARASFNLIFLPSLGNYISDIGIELGLAKPTYNAVLLAIASFACNATWKLDGLVGWLSILSFACLVPINNYVIEINKSQGKEACINSRFSIANKITIVIGGILLVLGFVSELLP